MEYASKAIITIVNIVNIHTMVATILRVSIERLA